MRAPFADIADTPTARSRSILALAIATAAFGAALYTRRTGNVWLGVGIASVCALGSALVLRALPPFRVERRAIPAELALGAVLGLGMALLTHLLVPLALGLLPGAEAQVDALYANLQHPPGPVAALPVLALAVVAEEVVWRGVAIDVLGPNAPRALFGAALLYAIPQVLSGSWLLFVLALVCGVAWGLLRLWRGSLWAPMATHFAWNLVVFVFWPLT